MISIHSLSLEELSAWCLSNSQPDYRARQIWRWLYVQRAATWNDMTNLPAPLRALLKAHFLISTVFPLDSHVENDGTGKLLIGMADNQAVETVIIPSGERRTVCVSSQIGCKFGCLFCASGQAGFVRNLEAGEIVGQILHVTALQGEVPDNIVVMGMGEPFDNYENVLKAVRIINHPYGLNVGARRITISTSGVVPGIERLAAEGLQIELSVSLHAADDDMRSRLMPVNRRYPLADLLAVCGRYTAATGRIITFEYTLIAGLNDSPIQAKQLAELVRAVRGRVNLIPLSPVAEFAGTAPELPVIREFARLLEQKGINVTLRQSRGKGIDGACGQLRLRRLSSPSI